MRCLTWRTSRICEANSTLGCRSLRSRHVSGWFAGLTYRLGVDRCAHDTFDGLRPIGEKLAVLAFRLALRAFGASPKYPPRISQISLIEANSTFVCRSLRSRHVWGWFAGLTNRLSVVRCAHATFGGTSAGWGFAKVSPAEFGDLADFADFRII